MKARYAQVGLGVRSWMYSIALAGPYAERHALVGLCDSNAGRLAQRVAWARANGLEVPAYAPADFERMITETRPDVVIVATPDVLHDDYAVRAMEAGCDVLVEKPLTIDAGRCRRLLDAQARTGRRCTVTFNYRYAPVRSQVKRLLAEGAIGDVLSVDFHWNLDTTHGADYFRRWHRRKENSGGLLVHKATHHFDLVNWWLGTVPERVFASGRRAYYRPETADRLGLAGRSERCLDCAPAARCPFRLDLRREKWLAALYHEHESHDGYRRDACVFSDEIDIEDAVAVTAEYASGARLAYSLHAFMPWEGYEVAFNGTLGRLEHGCRESVYVSGDGSVPGALEPEGSSVRIRRHREAPREVPVEGGSGGHGGGDALLLEALFGEPAPDALGRAADHVAGAWSIATGIAANRSIESGEVVAIADLLPELVALGPPA
ncbi:MAG TPA: Gfo/Idh/MocA family oxidoreductase [Myxococcota bacterium]|nr:Gfo/Idh/MocA family oxidoreductase [Myxococcota bacterium]